MTSTKLFSRQEELRSKLLQRYAQRAATPARIDAERLAEVGFLPVPRSQRNHPVAQKAKPLVLFQTRAKVVTPEDKKRFYAAARDPKNKDRKDFPIVELF